MSVWGESLRLQESSIPVSHAWAEDVSLLSWTMKISAGRKKLMRSRERALGCCSLLFPTAVGRQAGRVGTQPRCPDTHLLCLVCWSDEDYERGELGRADDLQGLWREGL